MSINPTSKFWIVPIIIIGVLLLIIFIRINRNRILGDLDKDTIEGVMIEVKGAKEYRGNYNVSDRNIISKLNLIVHNIQPGNKKERRIYDISCDIILTTKSGKKYIVETYIDLNSTIHPVYLKRFNSVRKIPGYIENEKKDFIEVIMAVINNDYAVQNAE